MKRILDTVHGYIMVGVEFITHIIDTPLFQRLRRIEQTSIRSVYPSARHDRFIHSLGVYHIGSLIVDHLKNEAKANDYWGETETTMMVLYNSYLAACLLHDIGHAPFSHSFEHYYGKKSDLALLLKNKISNKNFTADLNDAIRQDEPNFHEYMSAYIAFSKFHHGLSQRMNLNPEFVARMITGVYYNKQKHLHKVHNCFISLLHGKVIDADRLDYACRDVWASGYSTSSIDLRRLISALHIMRNADEDFVVCFESNSLNEIEGVLNVKDFQVKYVINHHVVCYEQWLLKMAAETMALNYYPEDSNGALALGKILNDKAITDSITIPSSNLVIRNISDDDLIFLLKQNDNNNYYRQWYSRQYSHSALWKSKDEFYHFFGEVEKNKSLKHNKFEERVKGILTKQFKIEENSIIILPTVFKPRVQMNSLYLVVANDIVRYTDIYPEMNDINEDIYFYYVFIPKDSSVKRAEWIKYRTKIVEALRPIMKELYTNKQNTDTSALLDTKIKKEIHKPVDCKLKHITDKLASITKKTLSLSRK